MDIAARDAIVAQFRRQVYAASGFVPFPHQAEWQLASEGWTLLDAVPAPGDHYASVLIPTSELRYGEAATEQKIINTIPCSVVRRTILPRVGGIAHVLADLAGFKAGKSYAAAAWLAGFACVPDALIHLVALQYSTAEPEFNYLAEFLLSDRGMNMKAASFHNDKRGGRMRIRLKTGAEFEVKSWEQKEGLKGKTITAYCFCLPADAPIWMGDYSQKSISEVEVGDCVIGWARGRGPRSRSKGKNLDRQKLTRAWVTKVQSRWSETLTIRCESGRVIRCTPDHRWLVEVSPFGKRNYDYREAQTLEAGDFGDHLCVIEGGLDVGGCPPQLRETAAWLGGMYDGEGCATGISQSRVKPNNRYLVGKLISAFGKLKFDAIEEKVKHRASIIRWRGGRREALRFLQWVPSYRFRRQYADRFLLTQRFRVVDRIVSIERNPLVERVYCLTTETENYVAYGACSHNCEAYQLPGLECFTSLSQNVRELKGYALFPTTPDRPWVGTLHDFGHGRDPDFHCTCNVNSRCNPFTFDQKAYDRDDPDKGGLMTREKFNIAWLGKLGAFVGRCYDFNRGDTTRFFSPLSHPGLWKKAVLEQDQEPEPDAVAV